MAVKELYLCWPSSAVSFYITAFVFALQNFYTRIWLLILIELKQCRRGINPPLVFFFFSLFFFCDFFLSVFLSCLMIICSSCSQSVSFSFKLSFMRQSLEKDQHWSRNFCFLLCVNPARHSGTLFENDAFGCGFILCFIGLPLSLYCTSTACSFLWVAVARWRSLPFSPKIKMGTAVRLVMMISSRASQRYLFSHTFCHP